MTSTTAPDLLRIGVLSKRSEVPIKTIRYYEELGLIQASSRTSGGFRLFHPDILARLAFIKRAQRLGLSLQEIGDILIIHDEGHRPCREVKQTLRSKIATIEERIQELTLLREHLQALIDHADEVEQDPADICPIIEQS